MNRIQEQLKSRHTIFQVIYNKKYIYMIIEDETQQMIKNK